MPMIWPRTLIIQNKKQMLLETGNKVKFIHTGATGRIVRQLKDGLFIIDMGNGIEVPAVRAFLEQVDKDAPLPKVKTKMPKTHIMPQQPAELTPKPEYEHLRSEGIQLAFKESNDGSMKRYEVHILNVTLYQALYDLEIVIKGQVMKKSNGQVPSNAHLMIMEMPSDYLSDNPSILFNCRQISTEGMTDWLRKELKIRPKQFFSKIKVAPILDSKAHVYPLFEPYELKEQNKESLEKYTKEHIRKNKNNPSPSEHYKLLTAPDVHKYASFPLEKDLHIEKLVDNPKKLLAKEILPIQIKAFEAYMDEAIKLGVEKVFVIHGKGTGRLKNEIATQLTQHPNVRTFKNEFHPKYEHGATEILFY